MSLAANHIQNRRRISAQNDPTEAPAAAFDAADEKLAELESNTSDLEEEVMQLQQDLDEKTAELKAAMAEEIQQQNIVEAAYQAWSQAHDALPDGALFTDITVHSLFAVDNFG